MEHSFFVKGFILPLLANGKDLEVRVNNKYVRMVTVGDIIVFNNVVRRKVTGVRKYPDFASMLEVEDYKRLYPNTESKEWLLSALSQIYRRTQELEGVFIFELQQE